MLRAKYKSDLSQLRSSAADADQGLISRLVHFYSVHTPGETISAVRSKYENLAKENVSKQALLSQKLLRKHRSDLSVPATLLASAASSPAAVLSPTHVTKPVPSASFSHSEALPGLESERGESERAALRRKNAQLEAEVAELKAAGRMT